MWPGEFVNARLLVDTIKSALVVPNSAIQRGPNGLFVWTVTDKSTATPKPVKVGQSVGDMTIVTSGVNARDRVITGGQYKLRKDVPISITDKPSEDDASS